MARNKTLKPLAEASPDPNSSDDKISISSSTELEEEPVSSSEDEEKISSTPPPPTCGAEKLPAAATTSKTKPESEDSSEDEENTPPTSPPPPSAAKKFTAAATTTTSKTKPVSDDSPEVEKPFPKLKALFSSKPRSKPIVARLVSEKRPSDCEDKGTAKRPRKEKSGLTTPVVVQKEGSKKHFQRVFSEDDDIEILKRMIEYRAKNKADLMNDVDDVYEFITKSLRVSVSKGQIVDKVRRLRKKFHNAKKKMLTNPYEIQSFKLSKKIWENNGGNDVKEEVSDGMVETNNVATKSNSEGRKLKSKSGNGGVLDDQKNNTMEEEETKMVGKIIESGEKEENTEVGEAVSMESMRKEGLRKMGAKARAEIKAMWDKVALARWKLETLRREAQEEESRRIMEALNH